MKKRTRRVKATKRKRKATRSRRRRGPVSNWRFTIADARRVAQRMAEDYAGKDWDEEFGQDTAESLRRIVD